MKPFLSSIIGWFRSLLQRRIKAGSAPEASAWKDIVEPLLNALMSGPSASPAEFNALLAHHDELTAERARQQALCWQIDLNMDLAGIDATDALLAERLRQLGVPDRSIQTKGAAMRVALGDYECVTPPPDAMPSLAEVIATGIRAAHEKRIVDAAHFPPNRHPFSLQDVRLKAFAWDEIGGGWVLEGAWQPSVHERTPLHRCPAQSIELRRCPPTAKPLIAAHSLPALTQVTLSVVRWQNGKHQVHSVYEHAADAPAPMIFNDPERPDELLLAWPGSAHPPLDWWHSIFEFHSPAVRFVQQQLSVQAGKPADWLHPWSREAVFAHYEHSLPVTDLRASLMSGPTGPAPLPEGTCWPVCPCCGEPALFSQSLDMRDVAFADLLPGTTIVVFACNDCLDAGEWTTCPLVIWLPRDHPVTLVDRGGPVPLLQATQWYDADFIDWCDLPQEVWEPLIVLDAKLAPRNTAGMTCLPHCPPCHGTKAGGVPNYLQADPEFYDRTGCAMEYIAQLRAPGHISANGFGYVFHSTTTGETYVEFQDT